MDGMTMAHIFMDQLDASQKPPAGAGSSLVTSG